MQIASIFYWFVKYGEKKVKIKFRYICMILTEFYSVTLLDIQI